MDAAVLLTSPPILALQSKTVSMDYLANENSKMTRKGFRKPLRVKISANK